MAQKSILDQVSVFMLIGWLLIYGILETISAIF